MVGSGSGGGGGIEHHLRCVAFLQPRPILSLRPSIQSDIHERIYTSILFNNQESQKLSK